MVSHDGETDVGLNCTSSGKLLNLQKHKYPTSVQRQVKISKQKWKSIRVIRRLLLIAQNKEVQRFLHDSTETLTLFSNKAFHQSGFQSHETAVCFTSWICGVTVSSLWFLLNWSSWFGDSVTIWPASHKTLIDTDSCESRTDCSL